MGIVFKHKERRFRLDIRKKFLTQGAVRHWNRIPRGVVVAPFLEVLKAGLDGGMGPVDADPAHGRGLELDGFQGPFQPKPLYNSMVQNKVTPNRFSSQS